MRASTRSHSLGVGVGLLIVVLIISGCGSDGPETSSAPDSEVEPAASETTADSDGGASAASDSALLGDNLCPQFEGQTIAGVGPLILRDDGLLSETMRGCSYLVEDESAGLQLAVSTAESADYASFVAGGGAEAIDDLGDSAVAITAQDVRVKTSAGPELIVTVFDYVTPNDQGTFADLERSEEAARHLIEALELG